MRKELLLKSKNRERLKNSPQSNTESHGEIIAIRMAELKTL
jgi:hypothetical protein